MWWAGWNIGGTVEVQEQWGARTRIGGPLCPEVLPGTKLLPLCLDLFCTADQENLSAVASPRPSPSHGRSRPMNTYWRMCGRDSHLDAIGPDPRLPQCAGLFGSSYLRKGLPTPSVVRRTRGNCMLRLSSLLHFLATPRTLT